jgi:hypothetical protein
MTARSAVVEALSRRFGPRRSGELWPCPKCGGRGAARVSLAVGSNKRNEPLRCLNGCAPSEILIALLEPCVEQSEQGSACAAQGSPSARQESSSKSVVADVLPCRTLDCSIDEIGRSDHARDALPALGIDAEVGERFRCILPGHDDDPQLSASVWFDPRTNLLKYRCWHHDAYGTPEWLRLCDVRAAVASGKVLFLSKGTAALWYLRLWHDAGLVDAVPVDLAALPRDARAELRAVAEGFRLLVGLRALVDGKPTPFADRLVGPWCGLSRRAAVRAREDLLRLNVIQRVGELQSGWRPTPLYAPGAAA